MSVLTRINEANKRIRSVMHCEVIRFHRANGKQRVGDSSVVFTKLFDVSSVAAGHASLPECLKGGRKGLNCIDESRPRGTNARQYFVIANAITIELTYA